MDEQKCCLNCKYLKYPWASGPCDNCFWVSNDSLDKFEARDLDDKRRGKRKWNKKSLAV